MRALNNKILFTDYHPFGSPMPGRNFNLGSYKYGFNGKENDNETVSTGEGTQDYGARIYNPALGKFLSVDPLSNQYPFFSPYQFAGNSPVRFIDMDGAEPFDPMGMQLHYYYMGEIAKKNGEDPVNYIKEQTKSMAKAQVAGAFLGVTTSAGIAYAPVLAWWAANPANQTLIVGLTGLTASFLDPDPNADYPGGLDDVGRGVRMIVKNAAVEKFVLNTGKFDYLLGKVVAGIGATKQQLSNTYKSAERAGIFKALGIEYNTSGKNALVGLFNNALENGKEVGRFTTEHGTTITKQIEVISGKTKGTVNVGFFYKNNDFKAIPEISTAVPKLE